MQSQGVSGTSTQYWVSMVDIGKQGGVGKQIV